MSKRIKLPVKPRLESVADLEENLARICTLEARLQAVNAEMSDRVTAVRREYEVEIATAGGELEILRRDAKDYADAHPELFADKKSAEFTHATIGYRTGTPKLKPRKGFTWDAVLENIRRVARNYLRTKEEINKDGLLADRELLGDEKLGELGVQVVQDETFFLTPKLESVAA